MPRYGFLLEENLFGHTTGRFHPQRSRSSCLGQEKDCRLQQVFEFGDVLQVHGIPEQVINMVGGMWFYRFHLTGFSKKPNIRTACKNSSK